MYCSSCGTELNPSLKFCEKCGTPVAAAQTQAMPQAQTGPIDQMTAPIDQSATSADQQAVPADQPTIPVDQSTVPVDQPYVAEVPGDSAWEAQPQQAYQVDQTMQMPSQVVQPTQADQGAGGGYIPPAASPQPPSKQAAQAFSMNQAPSSAFILAIVGLVLSALFVTFLPGIVCSIIALILNAGYNKKGLDNKHKTSTMVLGIIGLVIGALCLVLTIILGVTTAQVMRQIEDEGINIATDSVEVSTDSSGHVNIVVKSSSSASASDSSVSSAASASASSAASSVSSTAVRKYDDAKYHDSEWNPTLYSLFELDGAGMQALLEEYNYYWDGDAIAWLASDGSLFGALNASGSLSRNEIAQLPVGGAGEPLCFVLSVEGYDTPKAALSALTQNIVVEDSKDAGEVYFAIAYGSPMVEYLVAVTTTDTNEQTVLVFTNEAISSGLFAEQTGVDAGSSIDEVWKTVQAI